MIRIKCHTNIDRFKLVRWPEILACVPQIGHYVEGEGPNRTQPQLRIVRITHSCDRHEKYPVLLIELHE